MCVGLTGFDPLTSDVLGRLLAREGFRGTPGADTAPGADAAPDVVVVALSHLQIESRPPASDPWVALVDTGTAALRQAAKRGGAAGLVERSAGIAALGDALRAVAAGDAPEVTAPETADTLATLSRREVTVLRLITNGASNAAIAADLGISPNTARTHVQNVLTKLGVRNRLAAAAVGRSAGLDRTAAP